MLEIFKGLLGCSILTVSVYFFGMIVFNKREKNKIVYDIIVFTIICILHTSFFFLLDGTLKTILISLSFAVLFRLVFKSSYGKAILATVLYTILSLIPDILALIGALYILRIDKEVFYATMAGGVIGNLVVSLLMISIIFILKKPLRKIMSINISTNKSIVINAIITVLFVAFFFYKFATGYRLDQNVIIYLIAMTAFGGILFSLLKQKTDNDKIAKKYDELLDIMKNYENDIEE